MISGLPPLPSTITITPNSEQSEQSNPNPLTSTNDTKIEETTNNEDSTTQKIDNPSINMDSPQGFSRSRSLSIPSATSPSTSGHDECQAMETAVRLTAQQYDQAKKEV